MKGCHKQLSLTKQIEYKRPTQCFLYSQLKKFKIFFIRTCFILKKYIIFVETFKQNNMQTIETTTGKTRKELETLYTQAVKMLVEFGATPEQARQIARQSFKDAMGL